MRTLLIISALAITCGLTSCQKNIYREFHEFENYTWNRFDKVTFNISLDKADLSGDIILSIRYLEQFPYDEIPMQVNLRTPSGEERIIERTIKVKDDKGNFKGSVAGSFWDLEETLWKSFYFNQEGIYIIEIENINPHVGIPGIVDLGLIVKKK